MEKQKPENAGQSRRGVLKCLAWAGTGIVWTVAGGVPRPLGLGEALAATPADGFTFVQISDSHIGFNKEANPDPNATLQAALDRIGQLPKKAAMMIHTGDVSHLSKAAEFDAAEQLMKSVKLDTHYVPGEHDVIGDDGKQFFERFAKEAKTGGWYSFDQGGVHFIAMNNVQNFVKDGAGGFGAEQLEWLEKDVKGRTASTPIVVFTHVPMWPIYQEWGWATADERPHPPDRPEGRRECVIPHGDVDRLPATARGPRSGSGAAQGSRGATEERDRHPRGRHRRGEARCRHRHDPRLSKRQADEQFSGSASLDRGLRSGAAGDGRRRRRAGGRDRSGRDRHQELQL